MKRWPKGHRVDDEFAIVGEGQDDHFEELPVAARTDHQHLRRISVGVHVNDDQRMVDGVDHFVDSDAVSTRRTMKLHLLIVIRITGAVKQEGRSRPLRAVIERSHQVRVSRSLCPRSVSGTVWGSRRSWPGLPQPDALARHRQARTPRSRTSSCRSLTAAEWPSVDSSSRPQAGGIRCPPTRRASPGLECSRRVRRSWSVTVRTCSFGGGDRGVCGDRTVWCGERRRRRSVEDVEVRSDAVTDEFSVEEDDRV